MYERLQKKIDKPDVPTTEDRLVQLAGERGRIVRIQASVITVLFVVVIALSGALVWVLR